FKRYWWRKLIDTAGSISNLKYPVAYPKKLISFQFLSFLKKLNYVWDIPLVIIMILEFCSNCNQGYLKPTQRVVLEGEIGINFLDIGNKRIFVCDCCGRKQ